MSLSSSMLLVAGRAGTLKVPVVLHHIPVKVAVYAVFVYVLAFRVAIVLLHLFHPTLLLAIVFKDLPDDVRSEPSKAPTVLQICLRDLLEGENLPGEVSKPHVARAEPDANYQQRPDRQLQMDRRSHEHRSHQHDVDCQGQVQVLQAQNPKGSPKVGLSRFCVQNPPAKSFRRDAEVAQASRHDQRGAVREDEGDRHHDCPNCHPGTHAIAVLVFRFAHLARSAGGKSPPMLVVQVQDEVAGAKQCDDEGKPAENQVGAVEVRGGR
mmetsp:Transcript_5532/g.7820  ORF Transcript_5532/g.7820 Transcript_5532/m.7820 type:complete len:266 (+) Transcript_5532:243-1040(+)